jgi:hypothetical protein
MVTSPILAAVFAVAVGAQQPDTAALRQMLQDRVAALKQSMAHLGRYQWVETTEFSLKGEVKKREQKDCRFGPDGTVQKTPVGGTASQEEQESGGRRRRGLKAKVVAKKVDELKELKDYMDRFGSLVQRYVPPDPAKMQDAAKAGKLSVQKSTAGSTYLVVKDYAKSGDEVALAIDSATRTLKSYNVASYLDDTADTVLVSVNFATLHDGTTYVQETILESKGREILIKTTNFGHRLVGQ